MTDKAPPMRVVVIGGHTRSVGKTSLVVDLVRAFPEARWTAVKITQFGDGICSRNGAQCKCSVDEHTVALDTEVDASSGTDTSRFLAAGAERVLWLRTKQGRLAEGMPLLRASLSFRADREEVARGPCNVIIESNSLLQFFRPNLYLVVLDPAQSDFKESALLHLDRADGFVLRGTSGGEGDVQGKPAASAGAWADVPARLLEGRPVFYQSLGDPLPEGLVSLVRERVLKGATVSF